MFVIGGCPRLAAGNDALAALWKSVGIDLAMPGGRALPGDGRREGQREAQREGNQSLISRAADSGESEP